MPITLEALRPNLSFDRTGYIAVTTAVKNIINANSQYTFEIFVLAQPGAVNQLFQRAASSTDRHGLAIDGYGKPTFTHYDGTYKVAKSDIVVLNSWAHIVATFNTRADMRIYVNTVPGATGTYVYVYPYSDIMIARNSIYSNDGLLGSIAYVRIYNRVLSETEIRYNYANPDNPVRNGLVLWFKMNERGGATLYDASGNNNNGTIHGGATWSEFWRDETPRLVNFMHSLTARALEKIDFTLANTDLDIGQRVRARRDTIVFFEGVVYERGRRAKAGVVEVSATAYSDLVAYDRHIVFRIYQAGTTAGAIIRDLAALVSGVDVTNVDDGPSLNSPWEIENAPALEVMKSTAKGTNYYLRMRPGLVLYFKPKTASTPIATLDSTNTLSAEYSEDRWKLKNRVVYVGAGGQVLADVSEPPGDMPVVVHDPFLTDASEAQRRAQIRLALNKEYGRELRVRARASVVESAGIDLFSTVTVNFPSLGLLNVNMYIVEMGYDPKKLEYELVLGGRRELFEEFFEEQVGGDVAARFGQAVSVPEIVGGLQATVTTLQAAQRIQAQGRTVRLYNKPPLVVMAGANVALDEDGSVRLAAGFTSGWFEFEASPASELFARWLRAHYVHDPGEGSVSCDILLADGTPLFANVPPDFDIPYYPASHGSATNFPEDWDAVGGSISLTEASIVGWAAIRSDRTGSSMTLTWPRQRNAGFDILRFFRVYFYTFSDESITVKLFHDSSNYLTATVSNKGGAWRRWDIVTSSMTKTGNPTKMNWMEITTSAPRLLIDSDYLLYPAGREKLKMKFTLSRPSTTAASPKISLAKLVWREGKT